MFDSLRRRLPRIGRWPRLALAACCALLALDSAVSARAGQPVTAGARRPVVVAARELSVGHRITSRDVRMAGWPAQLVPPSAVQQTATVIGRRTASAFARGELLTPARLVGRDLTTGLPAGFVAAPVPLADDHAIDLLHPGDHVDLFASSRTDDALPDRRAESSAAPTGDHLLVLAVFRGTGESGTELVVAADRATAERISRTGVSQIITAVGVPP